MTTIPLDHGLPAAGATSPPGITRRSLLGGSLGAAGLAAVPALARARGPSRGGGGAGAGGAGPDGPGGGGDGGLPPWFPHQDPELVRRVVGASHGDLATVRELVGRWPELAKAQWDWGFGDWESALGAASHTGNREIAELLLSHGARPTLFSAAMLGQLAVVRAFVEAAPGIQGTPGPHGIPLLVHARTGGEAAEPVVAYLEEVGGAGGSAEAGVDPERQPRYLGVYRADTPLGERFEVTLGRFGLMLAQAGATGRRLAPLGGDTFHPAGAPTVRVTFDLPDDGGPAAGFTLESMGLVLGAMRSGDLPGSAEDGGAGGGSE